MKKTVSTCSAFVLAFVLSICFFGCEKQEKQNSLWDQATYTEDQTFGEGDATITLNVEAEDKNVTFTLHTDKDTVGEALTEHHLIGGEEGPYGLYVKVVNGIEADYDKNQSFWSFTQNGEVSMTGVDQTEIQDGVAYALIYTK